MTIITKDTAQKIDYLIQGVQDGKFDEVAQKIEFIKKLSGDHDAPDYFQELLRRIDTLEEEKHEMKNTISDLIQRNVQHLNEINELKGDMNAIAKGLQWMVKPDALANELYDIENFITRYGARKY